MAISVTAAAAQAIREAMQKEGFTPEEAYLRLGVKGGGCSGMSYHMAFEREPAPGDQIFESHGVRLVVDRKSYLLLNGTELDFGGSRLMRSFKFNNPNVVAACGCGTSFSVE